MLFKTLDNLRTKPKAVRQRVAFATALSFTLLVGGIWALTLPARFSPDTLASNEGTAPFAGMWAGFRDQFSSLRQQASVVAGAFSSTTAASTTPAAATTSEMIDIRTLVGTSTTPTPTPAPVLIGTTSATVTASSTN
ncbi:MAG: hypothetical protein RLZZ360_263 [Candidatus Parcubacteria bacterium]|jgi:hypothetical protein